MSQVVRTTLSCPRCGHHFPAIVEQIIDVGIDPQAKARFLSGRINMITCPNCGHNIAIGTPLIYHDPQKELLLVYVPMELNISAAERERAIGDLTRHVINGIPQEKRRAYLLTPRQAMTIPGMIDMILDADGITAEMREAQREKMRVMEMFLSVHPDQWPALLEEQAAHIDQDFLQMALVTAQNAADTGQPALAEALMAFYSYLIANTDIGQEIIAAAQAQEEVVQEVAQTLQAMGQGITREDFMSLVISYAGDEDRVQAVVGLMRPAFDYVFFQELSQRIDATEGDERQTLLHLRDRLLELVAVIDQQTQAVIQRAADTLRVIASSEDIDAAIRPRLDMIDDTFLAVLQANIQAAEQHNDAQTADRLKLVLQKVLETLRESAPPQIRLINDLMNTTEDEAHDILKSAAPQFGPELTDFMEAIARDLDENGQADSAQRLRSLKDIAARYIGSAPATGTAPGLA